MDGVASAFFSMWSETSLWLRLIGFVVRDPVVVLLGCCFSCLFWWIELLLVWVVRLVEVDWVDVGRVAGSWTARWG